MLQSILIISVLLYIFQACFVVTWISKGGYAIIGISITLPKVYSIVIQFPKLLALVIVLFLNVCTFASSHSLTIFLME